MTQSAPWRAAYKAMPSPIPVDEAVMTTTESFIQINLFYLKFEKHMILEITLKKLFLPTTSISGKANIQLSSKTNLTEVGHKPLIRQGIASFYDQKLQLKIDPEEPVELIILNQKTEEVEIVRFPVNTSDVGVDSKQATVQNKEEDIKLIYEIRVKVLEEQDRGVFGVVKLDRPEISIQEEYKISSNQQDQVEAQRLGQSQFEIMQQQTPNGQIPQLKEEEEFQHQPFQQSLPPQQQQHQHHMPDNTNLQDKILKVQAGDQGQILIDHTCYQPTISLPHPPLLDQNQPCLPDTTITPKESFQKERSSKKTDSEWERLLKKVQEQMLSYKEVQRREVVDSSARVEWKLPLLSGMLATLATIFLTI